MTGDLSVIRGALKPHMLVINEVQGFMTEEEKAEARRIALDIIREYRDGGCQLPPPPSMAEVQEMMDWLYGARARSTSRCPREMEADGGPAGSSSTSTPTPGRSSRIGDRRR
jgi:4-hydroxyacetophenone monooxygenase